MNTLKLTIHLEPKDPWADILVAELSENGFDAFEDLANGLVAYGPEDKIDLQGIEIDFLKAKKEELSTISFQTEIIPFKNWNEEWEKGFEPVFVDERLTILAPFHDKKVAKGLVIEIQPQMSFGTGHHQTTWLMSKALLDRKTLPNRVLDMGAGTGVLAILAEKLGAKEIVAIEIEDWSVVNVQENVERNHCQYITCICGGEEQIGHKQFDLILANINKNVLKNQMSSYFSATTLGGSLMISGFFDSDVAEMIAFAENSGFIFVAKSVKETWAMLEFIKK